MQMKNIQIGNGGLLVQLVCEFLFIIIQKDLLRFEQKWIVKIKSRSFLNFIYLIVTVTIYLVSFLRFLLVTTVIPTPEPISASTHNRIGESSPVLGDFLSLPSITLSDTTMV